MTYIRVGYLDFSQCCDEFIKGVELLEQSLVEEALSCFKGALETVSEADSCFYRYHSYYGLAKVLCGDQGSIEDCRKAASVYPFDGDIYMNLVRAELFLCNRLNAVKSIEQGLQYSASHSGLQALREKVGWRKRNPLPVLARDSFLNRLLGRWIRKKNSRR